MTKEELSKLKVGHKIFIDNILSDASWYELKYYRDLCHLPQANECNVLSINANSIYLETINDHGIRVKSFIPIRLVLTNCVRPLSDLNDIPIKEVIKEKIVTKYKIPTLKYLIISFILGIIVGINLAILIYRIY